MEKFLLTFLVLLTDVISIILIKLESTPQSPLSAPPSLANKRPCHNTSESYHRPLDCIALLSAASPTREEDSFSMVEAHHWHYHNANRSTIQIRISEGGCGNSQPRPRVASMLLFADAKGVAGLGKAGGDGTGGSDKAGQQVPPEVYNALTYAGTAFLFTLSAPFILYGLNKLLNKIEDCFGCGPSSKREKRRNNAAKTGGDKRIESQDVEDPSQRQLNTNIYEQQFDPESKLFPLHQQLVAAIVKSSNCVTSNNNDLIQPVAKLSSESQQNERQSNLPATLASIDFQQDPRRLQQSAINLPFAQQSPDLNYQTTNATTQENCHQQPYIISSPRL